MVLRIDPTLALIWRSVDELQIGAPEPVATARVDGDWELHLVEQLRLGVSAEQLHQQAAERDEPDARQRLELLLASLERSFTVRRDRQTGIPTLAVPGRDPSAVQFRRALAATGARCTETVGEVTVLFGHYLIDPADYRPLLNRDQPHLAVMLDDAAVRVSPVIIPGKTGCLYCFEQHRADADSAWPQLAAQLLRRRTVRASDLLLAAAAIEACFTITRHLSGTERSELSVLTADGQRRREEWQAHERCDCCWAAATPPENVTVLARRARPVVPSSGSARRARG